MRQLAAAILIVAVSPSANAGDNSVPAIISSDTGAKQPPDQAPSLMTGREIEAYNVGLDRAHRYYITCRREPVIGSLARKLRVCRTNEQWKSFSARGNEESRAILDTMSSAPANQTVPPY
jgi:hypothetical protein